MSLRHATASSGILFVLFILVSGCIIPIAPEFQAEKNQPPFVTEAMPPVGSLVTDPVAKFDVRVQDPNPSDSLYVRWLIDYPPFVPDVTHAQSENEMPPTAGAVNEHRLSFRPDCVFPGISRAFTTHRLMLVLSDRPFIVEDDGSGNPVLDKTAGAVSWWVWNFEKDCN